MFVFVSSGSVNAEVIKFFCLSFFRLFCSWVGETKVDHLKAQPVQRLELVLPNPLSLPYLFSQHDIESWHRLITLGVPVVVREPVSGPVEGEQWSCNSVSKISRKNSGKLVLPIFFKKRNHLLPPPQIFANGTISLKGSDILLKEIFSGKPDAPVIGSLLATTNFIASGSFLPSCAASSLSNHVASTEASEFVLHTVKTRNASRALVEVRRTHSQVLQYSLLCRWMTKAACQ